MLLLSRNYVFRVYPINRDYSGPAERVRLVTCRLTCDYPAKEYHHNQFSMLPYQKAQIYLLLGCLLDLITCLKLSLSKERLTGISSISAQSSPKHV